MILRSFVVLVFAAGVAAACWLSPEPRAGDDCGVVMSLPERAGAFVGRPGEVSQKEKDTLPADTEIVRMVYQTAAKDLVTASIILAGAERRSIHRPEVCLSGQGWTLLDAKTLPVEIKRGESMEVRDLLIEKPVTLPDGGQRRIQAHYVYWFVGSDVTTPSNWTRMWLSTRDSIMRNVNHRWAYPAVMAVVTDGFKPGETKERARTADETLRLITALVGELAPTFQRSLMNHPVAQTTP
ncbi:MAG: EpsI family protein [Verrucomicrobiaceae bacterium]|nr:EpsI family protein [Verrucomicrobiaceae bacterium]